MGVGTGAAAPAEADAGAGTVRWPAENRPSGSRLCCPLPCRPARLQPCPRGTPAKRHSSRRRTDGGGRSPRRKSAGAREGASRLDPVQEGVRRRPTALDPVREAIAAGPVVGGHVDGLRRASFDHFDLDAAGVQRAILERGRHRWCRLGSRRRARLRDVPRRTGRVPVACECGHISKASAETRVQRRDRGGSREHAVVFRARSAGGHAWDLELGHVAA